MCLNQCEKCGDDFQYGYCSECWKDEGRKYKESFDEWAKELPSKIAAEAIERIINDKFNELLDKLEPAKPTVDDLVDAYKRVITPRRKMVMIDESFVNWTRSLVAWCKCLDDAELSDVPSLTVRRFRKYVTKVTEGLARFDADAVDYTVEFKKGGEVLDRSKPAVDILFESGKEIGCSECAMPQPDEDILIRARAVKVESNYGERARFTCPECQTIVTLVFFGSEGEEFLDGKPIDPDLIPAAKEVIIRLMDSVIGEPRDLLKRLQDAILRST